MSAPPGTLLEEIGVADWLFAKVAGTRNFLASGVSRPLAPGLCGHFASADLRSRIQGSLPQDANQPLATSAIITASFRLSLPQLCRAPVLIGGTLTQLLEQSLVTLLRSKGACEGDVPARAAALITKLGADPVQCALSSSAPWKQLKALASLTSPPLQLILPSELQRQIAIKGQDASAGNRLSKQKQPKPKIPDHDLKAKFQALQPAQVQIPTEVFVNGTTGIFLGRLQVSEISPQAEGVVLASSAEALPYLTLDRPVSSEALALLVPGELSTEAAVANLFLANFRPRRLSPSGVRSGFRQHVQSRESLCFLVAWLAIFKDQWPGAWADFTQGPVKAIVQAFPCLRTCAIPNCGCTSWHGVDNSGEPEAILELFGRQFVDDSYRQVPASQTTIFNIFVRIPNGLEPRLQSAAGQQGLYAEPRGSDARQPSAKYAVIWMPRATYQDVLLWKQSHAEAISIARVGCRFRLRCTVADAQALHGKVRPDAAFVSRPGTKLYHTGPCPFGAQRSNLCAPSKPSTGRLSLCSLSLDATLEAQESGRLCKPRHQRQCLPLPKVKFWLWNQIKKEPPCVTRPPLVASKAALQRFQTKAVHPGVGTSDHLQVQDPWRHYLDARGAAQAAAHGQASAANVLQARGPVTSGQGISQADFSVAWNRCTMLPAALRSPRCCLAKARAHRCCARSRHVSSRWKLR